MEVEQSFVANKTTVILNYSKVHEGGDKCAYCNDQRKTHKGLQTEGFIRENSSLIFSKLRVDDLEKLFLSGFQLQSFIMYKKDNLKGCCEIYQYRVPLATFEPSKS